MMSGPSWITEKMASVMAVLVGGTLAGLAFTPALSNSNLGVTASALEVQAAPDDVHPSAMQLSRTFGEIAELIRPSLVHIDCVLVEPLPAGPAGLERPALPGGGSEVEGVGSGVIVSDDGYILTNSHLVRNAQTVHVRLVNGATYPADVIGADTHTEVSVLKIEASGLIPVAFGNSDKLAVGDWVLAIGNPFGLDHSVTAGIISAKGRSNLGIAGQEEFIQTDAAINPGNSGGPLVNLNGEVIGINTAIASKTGSSAGIGFAIPANLARRVMETMIEEGGIRRGWLGLSVQELTRDMASSFGFDGAGAVLISDVESSGPAQKAGLRPGDIVLSFEGTPIFSPSQFRNVIAGTAPGTAARVEVFRAGKREELVVDLAARPEDIAIPAKPPSPAASSPADLGLEVHDLTPELAQRLGAAGGRGALITRVNPGTIAARAGIKPGDVVLSIGDQEISSASDYSNIIQNEDLRKGTRVQIRSIGGNRKFIFLKRQA